MPVIVAPDLYQDWLASVTVAARKIVEQVLMHPDPTLIVELERRPSPPKPRLEETHQLTLF
jgi:hypothetical protein